MPYYSKYDDSDDEYRHHRHHDSDDERPHHHKAGKKNGSKRDVSGEESGRDVSEAEGGRNISDAEKRDVSGEDTSRAVTEHVQNLVGVYSQIATNSELQSLRQQNRGLFDTLLQHAVPFALNAASSAVKVLASSGKRDVGSDIAVKQHLPTAINFAHQILAIPEVQENRGFFDKIFHIGMPLVLNTAQTLLGAKRSVEGPVNEEQRGFFDAIVGKLPGVVFGVLNDVVGGGRRDVGGEDRGFFDIIKKIAPIVMNVAGAAVQSLNGQRSLAFAPTDRGFFDKLKKVAAKVMSNPLVQKVGSFAINQGVKMAQSYLGGQGRDLDGNNSEYAESHVRGFFGSMLQSLAPIAMGALQGAVGAVGKRDLALVPAKRSIFDIVAQHLPAIIQAAQQAFAQKRAIGGGTEDETAFLQRVVAQSAGPLIAAAREEVANPGSQAARGILGSLLGNLLPF